MKLRLVFGALLVAFGMTFWWSTSQAQEEEDVCVESCRAQHEQCIESCAQHPNPVECDADCREDSLSCTQECR